MPEIRIESLFDGLKRKFGMSTKDAHAFIVEVDDDQLVNDLCDGLFDHMDNPIGACLDASTTLNEVTIIALRLMAGLPPS